MAANNTLPARGTKQFGRKWLAGTSTQHVSTPARAAAANKKQVLHYHSGDDR
jgi:hypothetical protein